MEPRIQCFVHINIPAPDPACRAHAKKHCPKGGGGGGVCCVQSCDWDQEIQGVGQTVKQCAEINSTIGDQEV